MKFEFDEVANTISFIDYDDLKECLSMKDKDPEDIRCLHGYQYRELCKILLTPSQFDRHIACSHDGIYRVSRRKYLKGLEYMKNNIWNKK